MEKEFVTYEQALALKELGFDEECMGYFNDREFKYCLEDELVKNSLMSNSNSPIFYTTRPLKQQVFRWFREEYNLEGIVQRAEDYLWYKAYIYKYCKETKNIRWGIYECDIYEEAENACINKLIEIVKS